MATAAGRARIAKAKAASVAARRARFDERVRLGLKQCPDCCAPGQMLPMSMFSPSQSPDGCNTFCRPCMNIRMRASKKRRREAKRQAEFDAAAARNARFLLRCCSGPFGWDDELHWWRAWHDAACKQRWQPHPPGPWQPPRYSKAS